MAQRLSLVPISKSLWATDKTARFCMCCEKQAFGYIRARKHHCRLCGDVVCGPCSMRRHPLVPTHRVCALCYAILIEQAAGVGLLDCYHGALSDEATSKKLLRAGDFLVRHSPSVEGGLVLSVLRTCQTDKAIEERLPLLGGAGSWHVRPDVTFVSVHDLLRHYQKYELTPWHFLLQSPVINPARAALQREQTLLPRSPPSVTCGRCGRALRFADESMRFCEACGADAISPSVYEELGSVATVQDARRVYCPEYDLTHEYAAALISGLTTAKPPRSDEDDDDVVDTAHAAPANPVAYEAPGMF